MEDKERKDKIFKGLKFHLNELKRLRPEYEYLMIAIQGSQNYNLDLDEPAFGSFEGYKSDIDTVAIVLPPFENFVNNEKYVSETIVLDNNEHIDVKDIRQIFDIFMKQNIKYLEILHTDFRIINPKFKMCMLMLLESADRISKSNPHKLIACTYGMCMEKVKALEHPYEGLKEKIAKYGYDGKQLHHIIRLYMFAERYINNGFDFKKAMDFADIDTPDYIKLSLAKKNINTLEEARALSGEYSGKLSELRAKFSATDVDITDEITEMFLNNLKANVFRLYFEDMFTPEEEKKTKKVLTPTADRVFFTSDLHFGHMNILGFEPKRWELTGTTESKAISQAMIDDGLTNEEIWGIPDDLWDNYKKIAYRNCIEKHDEELIRRWNETISKNDLVFILGDLSFRNAEETEAIVKRLNGRKVLVKGNHDIIWLTKNFDTSLFEEIVDYKEIKVNGNLYVLSHYPMRVWNKQHKGSVHLFGHIHSNETTSHPMKEEIQLSYNVGTDVNDYRPVSLEVYVKTAEFYKNFYLNKE